MHGDADPTLSLRLAEDVQWQLDPLHFLVTLDRFTVWDTTSISASCTP
jgi:hypothetical protein